ncbi:hypothetical protein GOODEAATRI_025783 [Goodea atripinnis]|uniref:Uncharacterized protein n=1 Tax=Goodea atripinnis TaxID=208336 RepID=A0ABV0MVW0_9TELE
MSSKSLRLEGLLPITLIFNSLLRSSVRLRSGPGPLQNITIMSVHKKHVGEHHCRFLNTLGLKQLLDDEGNLLSYQEFLCKFNLPVSPTEYEIISYAIPDDMIQLYQHSTDNTGALPRNVLVIDGVDIYQKKCSNRFMRSLLQDVVLPSGRFCWSSLYGEIDWNLVWLIGEKYCLNYKLKEIPFKI